MGLAASQARLLTITSRLSNTELRQQQIANTKMRLSADQEQVSTKYSNALNNQTLTLNDAPMTYSDLVAAGYSVVRNSDSVSAANVLTQNVQKPTLPRPENVTPCKKITQTVQSGTQTVNAAEYMKSLYDSFSAVKTVFTNKCADYTETMVQKLPFVKQLSAACLSIGDSTEADYLNKKIAEAEEAIQDAQSHNYQNSQSGSYKISMNMFVYKHLNAGMTIWSNSTNAGQKYASQTITLPAESSQVEVDDPTDKARYEREYNASKEAWAQYDAAIASSGNQSQVDLAEALKSNSDFLIQGILSGYLTLMKDGQQVSLAGSKEISTVYDKSDDAQAEAEYNAAMAKINRKEKALDNEMKRLDTEHSALQTELESIKSIISDHAGKDFNLFS